MNKLDKPTLKKTLWYFTNMFMFKTMFPIPSKIKVNILKLYGAKIRYNVVIKPNVNRFLEVQNIFGAHMPKVHTKKRLGGESNKSLVNFKKKTLEGIRVLRKNNIGGYSTIIIKNLSKNPQFFKSI